MSFLCITITQCIRSLLFQQEVSPQWCHWRESWGTAYLNLRAHCNSRILDWVAWQVVVWVSCGVVHRMNRTDNLLTGNNWFEWCWSLPRWTSVAYAASPRWHEQQHHLCFQRGKFQFPFSTIVSQPLPLGILCKILSAKIKPGRLAANSTCCWHLLSVTRSSVSYNVLIMPTVALACWWQA